MASLPATTTQSTEIHPVKLQVAELIASGMPTSKIALKLAGGDKRKAHNLRRQIRRWVYTDPKFASALASTAKAEAFLQFVQAVPAVGKRAGRGRVDAFKVLGEFTGAHNPKVQHEHSGEINIKISGMPRPQPVADDHVVDAEVVEE
jgi:hypothetical protein